MLMAGAGASRTDLLEWLCAKSEPSRRWAVGLVVAHPDDETVSASHVLTRASDLHIVHVTDGAPRDMLDVRANGLSSCSEYAAMRREELKSALSLAGIRADQLQELHVPDQQASFNLVELTSMLAPLLLKLNVDIVVTHPYEGGHPDHDATAFAVHAARRLLARDAGDAPVIVEMSSYHEQDGRMTTCEFVSAPQLFAEESRNQNCAVSTVVLSDRQRDLKQRMVACFATQQSTLNQFPIGIERYRLAPRYDFDRLPNNGHLLYEQFPWGMVGERWCELARKALRELMIEDCM